MDSTSPAPLQPGRARRTSVASIRLSIRRSTTYLSDSHSHDNPGNDGERGSKTTCAESATERTGAAQSHDQVSVYVALPTQKRKSPLEVDTPKGAMELRPCDARGCGRRAVVWDPGRAHPIALLPEVRETDPENASRSEARRDGSLLLCRNLLRHSRGRGALQ